MAKAIAGFFRTRNEGEAARQDLLANGFSPEEVNFVVGDTRPHEVPAVGPVKEVGAENEAAQDAFIGGAVGLAAGMIAVAIPGIGPLIAMGPLAGALGGLSLGAAAGGVVGLLKDYGVSEEEAEFYMEGVRRGGSLITMLDLPEDRAKRAQDILSAHDPINVEQLKEEQSAA